MLTMHTVYYHPEDFPRHVVVRRCYVTSGPLQFAPVACLYDTLADARRDLAELHLYPLPRQPGDVPCIVETWV